MRLLVPFGALHLGALAPLVGVAGRPPPRPPQPVVRHAPSMRAGGGADDLRIDPNASPLHVFVIAGLAGLIRPSDMMMRNTLIAQTMTPARLIGALGLSRITNDSARVAGALAGAGVVAAFGIGPGVCGDPCLYAAGFGLTLGITRVRVGATATAATAAAAGRKCPWSAWGDLRHGLAYVRRKPELMAALSVAFLINVFAHPFVFRRAAVRGQEVHGVGQPGVGHAGGQLRARLPPWARWRSA
ncbi:MAG: hypothetical protein IPM02_12050 [Betaproteobacteria bacterium]|nr:hypothetical protein [Betaproteobacteria bacterium]